MGEFSLLSTTTKSMGGRRREKKTCHNAMQWTFLIDDMRCIGREAHFVFFFPVLFGRMDMRCFLHTHGDMKECMRESLEGEGE